MQSTMQDRPLTITALFEHGARLYGDSEVVTAGERGVRRACFAEVAERAARLAGALRRLGIRPGDRVATFGWNTQEHLEAYLAVPSMGAVLHTLNIRLFPEQLAYVANHAEDRVVLVDASCVPLLAPVARELRTVEHFVVIGDGDAAPLGSKALRHAELLAAEAPHYDWPPLDERAAAAMCYTSGTTGNPKGVVYSHRSTVLHSLGVCSASVFGLTQHDRVLLIVPMFHANAWGLPYAGWLTGADLLMPGRFLQPEPLCRLIAEERATVSGAVPTIWNDIGRWAETNPIDLSSLRLVICGGSAVPRSLMERFERQHRVRIVQAWGMTETSPLAAIALPPKGCCPEEELDWRAKAGRVVAGVELRVVDEAGRVLPWDGKSAGEIEVRGAWVTGAYHRESADEKFHDGWLRTGDVGTVDAKGFIQITDRAKDVIKSGGEWISSVELENALMAHPDVLEAAVIGVPDARWDERPLACVVPKPGAAVIVDELRTFLAGRVARWWVPERWSVIEEVPKTSVGKFDKKALRVRYSRGELEVVTLTASSPSGT
ncbi:MAG: long-chain fatty acid--CoA ligase [Deltaproteobacteria bacterium]|nr:MAG: long-chain fatty acid--CoA ligase [Deltaproteobacteria bacterium]